MKPPKSQTCFYHEFNQAHTAQSDLMVTRISAYFLDNITPRWKVPAFFKALTKLYVLLSFHFPQHTGMGAVQAAVKMLKENHSPQDRSKFLREAAIMGQFKHRNVVELYGVVADGTPVRRWAWRFSLETQKLSSPIRKGTLMTSASFCVVASQSDAGQLVLYGSRETEIGLSPQKEKLEW